MEQNRQIFGHLPNGTPVEELTLRDGALSCGIITYGGAVRRLVVPGRDANPVDIALGFDTLEGYTSQDKYMGAIVGRYANRIGGARFTLNGVEYRLAANDGPNSLHGGSAGFDKQVWSVSELSKNRVTLSLDSPGGQEGYPGALSVRVTYTLARGALSIGYWAGHTGDTVFNPSNHTYFNLSGHHSGRVEGQYIRLNASRYTPTLPGSIPTGELAPVDATPMDLRTAQPIGARINEPFGQLTLAGGYDHNWVIDGWDRALRPAALAWSPETGISMEVSTTLPGVQFYTGNYLDGCPAGKGGAVYAARCGFCLETQFFPDTPNQPSFPSCVLRAGEDYNSRTVYRFGTLDNAGQL